MGTWSFCKKVMDGTRLGTGSCSPKPRWCTSPVTSQPVNHQPVNLETISRPYKEITQENPRRTQEEPKTLPLCSLLAELMVENQCKPPTISNTWLDAERRLVNIDHRDPAEAEKVLRWCQKDQFWRANILSLPKFRAQYDKLQIGRAHV